MLRRWRRETWSFGTAAVVVVVVVVGIGWKKSTARRKSRTLDELGVAASLPSEHQRKRGA